MSAAVAPQYQLARTLAFALRARAVMIEKGLREAQRTCPWCNSKNALKMICCPDDGPFTLACTALPNCLNYTDKQSESSEESKSE